MNTRVFAAAFGCAILAGCVSLPIEQNDGVSINRVVERVKCELGKALLNQPELDSWIGNITLTLETDQAGSVTPTTALSGPFSTGTYGLEFAGGINGKSLQTSLVAINFEVWKLKDFASHCPMQPKSQLEDALGLQQWVERTFPLKVEEGASFISKEKAIGYTLEFDLELSAGITPSFTLARVNGKDGFTASRKTLNTLQVAMVDAGIVPPRTYTKTEMVPVTQPKSNDSANLIEAKPKFRPERRTVTSKGKGPRPNAQQRLNDAIQQLQLRNLRLRQ
ncbi:hypothetical protein JQ561_03860 [Bradyrhizobium diazoefficiens]|nr:hypothetical protein [Bradyrhizobium diazoefficiens]MBR0925731.1 hypothetical protein [Bradyrhizobium diazoefficiens]